MAEISDDQNNEVETSNVNFEDGIFIEQYEVAEVIKKLSLVNHMNDFQITSVVSDLLQGGDFWNAMGNNQSSKSKFNYTLDEVVTSEASITDTSLADQIEGAQKQNPVGILNNAAFYSYEMPTVKIIKSSLIVQAPAIDPSYTFYATDGDDYFIGGRNADTVFYDDDSSWMDVDRIDLGAGNDMIVGTDYISLSGFINMGADNDTITEDNIEGYSNGIIDMGTGNDEINVRSLNLYENSTVRMGAGNDTINSEYIYITDTGSLDLGDGSNTIIVTSFSIRNDTYVISGNGDDSYITYNFEMQDNANLDTGGGNDALNFNGGYIQHDSVLNMGAGNDTIQGYLQGYDNGTVNMGNGNDTINGDIDLYENSRLFMGAGNDSIFIDYLYMDGDSYLNMGDGDDILRGSLDIEEGTTVSMDSGNDTVIVEGPYEHFGLYGGSMLLMGEGDDYLDVGGGSGNYLQG